MTADWKEYGKPNFKFLIYGCTPANVTLAGFTSTNQAKRGSRPNFNKTDTALNTAVFLDTVQQHEDIKKKYN